MGQTALQEVVLYRLVVLSHITVQNITNWTHLVSLYTTVIDANVDASLLLIEKLLDPGFSGRLPCYGRANL